MSFARKRPIATRTIRPSPRRRARARGFSCRRSTSFTSRLQPAEATRRACSSTRFAEVRYSLWDLVRYMTKLGAIGFGGPVALVGYMHRDLVEQRQWISEADYKEGLTGATLAGVAFVLPSFLMVLALGAAYVAYGGFTWMQAVFYGVGAAVIGIIALSAYKLTTKSVGKDKLLWAIYLVAAAVTVITESEIVWIFLISGLLVWLVRAPPRWLARSGSAPMLALLPAANFLPAVCAVGASTD